MSQHTRKLLTGFRARMCVAALAALLTLSVAVPGSALAVLESGGSLQQRVESEPETTSTPTTTVPTSSSSTSGNSHTTILLAMGAAVLLLSGIAFVIVRDARRVAPATEAELDGGRGPRDTAVMMRKRRAKAKAARQQRKRNRQRRV